jgi:hypothetical protein
MTPAMVDEFVAAQGTKWRPLLAAAGVKPE